MQQPPHGQPFPSGGSPPPQHAHGAQGSGQGPRKPSAGLVAALVGGGLVVVVFLGLALRWAAHNQDENCTAAVEKARAAVAQKGPAGAHEHIAAAKGICKSLRREEIASLEGSPAPAVTKASSGAPPARRAPDGNPAPPAQGSEEEQLRKACKVGPSAHLQVADETDVKVMCHLAVEKLLKAPKSAEFPGVFDDDRKPARMDGCTTTYGSWVDAPNAFGAKIRTNYVCVYDPRTGIATPTTF